MADNPKPKVISDIPLIEATHFNFNTIADTLLEFIISAPLDAPFNICITGTWGSGKTTLLSTLERQIQRYSDQARKSDAQVKFVPLWFAPWKMSDETEVVNALVGLVLRHIETDSDLMAKAKVDIDRKDVVRLLSKRFLQIDPNEVSTYFDWTSRQKGSFLEVEALFRKVADTYVKDKRRFVVFVDDLDRCPPARIVSVLETVKLFFDMSSFIFVFALDRDQVERAISATYSGVDLKSARIYLEKIFQLSYALPRKDTEGLVQFVASTLNEMGLEIHSVGLVRALVGTYGHNLRNLKLFINTYNFQKYLLRQGTTPTGAIDDEILFKWLYLETTIPDSLAASLRRKSPDLITAIELLSRGMLLGDAKKYNQYARSLVRSEVQYIPLIIYSLLPLDESDNKLDDDKLNSVQKEFVDALRRDAGVLKCFEVLREGNSFLLDQDLQMLAYLSRHETILQGVDEINNAEEAEVDETLPVELSRIRFARDTILSSAEWDSLGDLYKGKALNRAAYMCYLMAAGMDYSNGIYWLDLALIALKIDRIQAAFALAKIAYRLSVTPRLLYPQLAIAYDIQLKNEAVSSLLYRKSIDIGAGSNTMFFNLAGNLSHAGDHERAFYNALHAYFLDQEDAASRVRAESYAQRIGKTELTFEAWNDALLAELQAGVNAGKHPYPLTDADEIQIDQLFNSYPDISDVQDELNFLSM